MIVRWLLIVFVCLLAVGCNASPRSAGLSPTNAARNPQRAAELAAEGGALIDSDPEEAMRFLRLAVEADLYYGPAHNNIGVLLLNRGDLYGAAEEFDWARRLMPGHPDPRINLGIALERGGKSQDAMEAYASAIEVYPNHLPAMQALARLQIRTGYTDESTQPMLNAIASRGDEIWKSWARKWLAHSWE